MRCVGEVLKVGWSFSKMVVVVGGGGRGVCFKVWGRCL